MKTYYNATKNVLFQPDKPLRIATLGPAGTCSEQIAIQHFNNEARPAEIILYPAFEESVQKLIDGEVDLVLIPSAYLYIRDIIMDNAGIIQIVDAFVHSTPPFVLVADASISKDNLLIAAHPSPTPLLKRILTNPKVVEARSNSDAFDKFVNGEVTACLTVKSEKIIPRLGQLNRFEIAITEIGSIHMSWNIFARCDSWYKKPTVH